MIQSIVKMFSSFKDVLFFPSYHVFRIGRKPLFLLDKSHNFKRLKESGFRFEFQDSYYGGKEAVLKSTDDNYDFTLKKGEFKFKVKSELIPFADDQFPYSIYFNSDKKLEHIIYFSEISVGFHIRKDITRPILIEFYPNGRIKAESYMNIDYSLSNKVVDYNKTRGWLTPRFISYDKDGSINKNYSYYEIFHKNGDHFGTLNFNEYEETLLKLNIKSSKLTEKDKFKLEIYFNFNIYRTNISDIIQHPDDLLTISDDDLDVIAMILK